MKKNYLNRGIIFVLAGICFLMAAVFTETVFDGLLWGFAGGALGPGIGMIIQHFYWSAPKNQERYREIQEQEDINLHDELNECILRRRTDTGAFAGGHSAALADIDFFCLSGYFSFNNDIVVLRYPF